MTTDTDLRSLTIQALSVLVRGRTYLDLLYLALSLPLAIVYFSFCSAAPRWGQS